MSQAQVAASELVGPYRVVRAIGAGGSARIDLAVIERAYGFQRHVVLKRPLEHLRTDPHVAETLKREAHLGGRLRHPNLVAVLDAGTHDNYVYLALEYVAGSSVRTIMQADSSPRVRALPLPAALSIIVGAARGLHEAHELAGSDGAPLGLVHRDVSPANILVDRDGTVKLSDFGIAKDTRVSTLSGSMRGTVTYMAPEQCRGHAFDRRADVFSLGVILHELISGRRLFWAENDVASLHKVLSAPIPDPRDAVPSLAPELCAIAMRAITRETDQRIASAAELADRLESFAARAGIVLGARAVAPLAAPATAPRETSKQVTAQIAAPASEPSLVTVIEGAAEPDDAIEPTFGPNAAGDDEIATPVRQPTYAEHLAPEPPARSHRWLVGAIAACALAGIGIGALVARGGDEPNAPTSGASATPSSTTPPSTPSKSESSTPSPTETAPVAAETDAAIDEPAEAIDAGESAIDDQVTIDEPDPKPTGSKKRPSKRVDAKRVDAARVDVKRSDDQRVPIDAGAAMPAKTDAGAPPKVEWNPKLVFPGDKPKTK